MSGSGGRATRLGAWWRSVSARLAASFLLVSVLLVSLSYAISIGVFSGSLDRYVSENPMRLAESVADQVSELVRGGLAGDGLKARLDDLAREHGALIVLYDVNGREIMRSGTADTESANWCPGPMAARGTRVVALPIVDRNRVVGYVGVTITRIGSIQAAAESFRSSVTRAYFFSSVAALFLALLIGLLLTRVLARPIRAAIEGAQRLAHGDYTVRLAAVDGSEIGQLAEAINLLAERLGELERRRLDAATDIAHEFKTPLTVLKANLEGIRDGVIPADAATLERLTSEIDRLAKLVDELRDARLLESPGFALELAEVDLREVVRGKAAAYEAVAAREGKELEVSMGETPLVCLVDAHRVAQVIDNLLSNAFRFTRPGGRVTVAALRRGDEAVVTVADTGVGIPSEKLPLVFERFYTADESRSRRTGGSGLGLAIAKRLVELMGGTIAVTSEPGVGTEFTVRFPLARR